ncbi:MAG: hypothetical protein SF029_15965 [bacterium]|nr:hypothetical protein [bacterium]
MLPAATTPASPLAVWLIRALLAALLLLGAEILLWTDPVGRPVWEWLLLIPGYLCIATIALDLMVRHRVRDFWGIMTTAGICGLLIGVILNPATGLADLPRTLVTRITGAYTLLALEMLIFFLGLTGNQLRVLRWSLIVGAVIVGMAWGTWVRFAPEQTEITFAPVSLGTMLVWGTGGVLIVVGLFALVSRYAKAVTPPDLLLSVREYAVVLPVLAVLLFIRVAQGVVDFPGIAFGAILLLICYAILWFRRNTKKAITLDDHLPPRPLSPVWLLLTVAVLYWMGIFTYSLPMLGTLELNQLTVIVVGFALYGLAWLPTAALFIGVRSYIRQTQVPQI